VDGTVDHAFVKNLHSLLKAGGQVSLKLNAPDLESLAKMVGFQKIQASEGKFEAQKLAESSGPAKIKRKAKAPAVEASNPWANLDSKNELINEDDLMKKGEQVKTKKFCGEGDGMQMAKPCANCNCGLKE
jgi:hypothetical protein